MLSKVVTASSLLCSNSTKCHPLVSISCPSCAHVLPSQGHLDLHPSSPILPHVYLHTRWKVRLSSEHNFDLAPHYLQGLINAAYDIVLMTGSTTRYCCPWSSDTCMHDLTWHWPDPISCGTIITMIIFINKGYIWQRWDHTAPQRTMTQTPWAGGQGMAVFWECETRQATESHAFAGCAHLCYIWGSR